MAERVADVLWSMLAGAGVKRCYGIVGDALNPVVDGLRRDGQVEFIHVRNEEAGAFAAVAEACLTNSPVAVCGTAGPGLAGVLHPALGHPRDVGPAAGVDRLRGVVLGAHDRLVVCSPVDPSWALRLPGARFRLRECVVLARSAAYQPSKPLYCTLSL